MKKLFFLFFSALLCTVASAHDFVVDGIYYEISIANPNNVYVTCRGSRYDSYSDEYSGSVVIPEKVTYNGNVYSVTNIDYGAFYDCSGLTSVDIPNSVTSIGQEAFSGCSGLTAVHITDLSAWCKIGFEDGYTISSNPLIYAHHLYLNGEEITNLVIPDDMTSIGTFAFAGCSGLTSVTIPNSVTSIGKNAFFCSGLTSVSIPNSVTSIGVNAFSGCSGLKSLRFEDSDKGIVIPYMGRDYEFGAFDGCPIEKLYIGRNLSTLAFSGKSTLSTIIIGNSVTEIDDNVFKGCTGLTNVRIEDGDSDITLSNTAFSQCPLDSLYLGRNISVSTNSSPFSGISTSSTVTIGKSVTKIGNYLFADCSDLASISFPNSVTTIGSSAFRGCSGLTSVTIPNSITSIGSGAFEGCI